MKQASALKAAEAEGYQVTRFNALRHGVLSRYTVLPWEDAGEYQTLLAALVAEHAPEGPTEEHLVEELAGVIWRKRRLRLAEAAAFRDGLADALQPFRKTAKRALVHLDIAVEAAWVTDAVRTTEEDARGRAAELDDDEGMSRRALGLLGTRRTDAYEAAVAALGEDTRQWWQELLASEPDELEPGEGPYTADAEGLRRFIEGRLLPWFADHRAALESRPLLRDQAFGKSLEPATLERLGRYEVHLDRKLERTLAMLMRLKELRPSLDAG